MPPAKSLSPRRPRLVSLALVLASLSGLAAIALADPPLPVIPTTTFSITSYGAVADGVTDNTAAINAAITAAKNAGGGVVVVPAASNPYMFKTTLTLATKVKLQVNSGATLKALPYNSSTNSASGDLIQVPSGSNNVEIAGPGTIDGNGSGWWSAFPSSAGSRPRLIRLKGSSSSPCDTIYIHDVTLSNSPSMHVICAYANNVTFTRVTVSAPSSSPNTDGIDPAGANILYDTCNISCGDDNIAVKAGGTPCSNITVRNCTFGTGHGLSVGGQTNLGLNGMTVTNCTFNGTTSGIRLKADPNEGGLVQNITYSGLTMTNVRYPIVFYSYYDVIGNPGGTSTTTAKTYNSTPPDPLNTTTMPTWTNITINGLKATLTSGTAGYSIIWGLPNNYVANVTLTNITFSGYPGFEIYNSKHVEFSGTNSVGTLTTYNAAVITTQPSSKTVTAGGSTSFTVAVAPTTGNNGTITPTYQWKKSGTALTNGTQSDGSVVSGATTATLTISNAKSTSAGSYTVTVTHKLDTWSTTSNSLVPNGASVAMTSNTASLTVN